MSRKKTHVFDQLEAKAVELQSEMESRGAAQDPVLRKGAEELFEELKDQSEDLEKMEDFLRALKRLAE